MRYVISAFLLLSVSSHCFAANALYGTVGLIRTITASHPNVDARGDILFQMDGGTLAAPCTWLYLSKDDAASLSILLAAKAMNSNVQAHYKSSGTTSWGGAAICEVENLDL